MGIRRLASVRPKKNAALSLKQIGEQGTLPQQGALFCMEKSVGIVYNKLFKYFTQGVPGPFHRSMDTLCNLRLRNCDRGLVAFLLEE